MGCCFSSIQPSSLLKNEPTIIHESNTDWVVAELKAAWEEGKRKGILTVKYCDNPENVKLKMKESGINVRLWHDFKPLDITQIHDKTYFILSKLEDKEEEDYVI